MAITSTVLTAFVLNGCTPEEPKARSYGFTVSRNNAVLSGSAVSIQTGYQNYTAKTGNDGKCEIKIPNNVSLPEYTIVTIDHSSIKPYCLSVSGSANAKTSLPINCQNVPTNTKVRESSLHHLGNDIYGVGSANSQLQLPTEGLYKTFSFNLTSIPGSMPYLQIYVRGIEHPMEIILNGITINTLGNSASNGDLSLWDFKLSGNPSAILRIGNNVLTIKTGATNKPNDPWDDIEFCGLLLYY